MKYLDYPEQQKHGSLDFPYYFYRVTPIHPRYTMPYHWHPLFEIVHVFQGQFHLQLDNCLLELNAGDTALIQGGLTHGGAPSPNEDCIYECILIDLETVFSHSTRQYEQALTDLLNSKILVRNFFPASFTDINQLIDQMLDLLRSKPKVMPSPSMAVPICCLERFFLRIIIGKIRYLRNPGVFPA